MENNMLNRLWFFNIWDNINDSDMYVVKKRTVLKLLSVLYFILFDEDMNGVVIVNKDLLHIEEN